MTFDYSKCKEILLEQGQWKTIDELWDLMKSTEGIFDKDYKESSFEKAGKAEIRSVLNTEDPKTGLPIGISIVGEDGVRRSKSPQLFDDFDYKQARSYHYDRMTHHGKMVRKLEHLGGLEQLSLDLRWIDGVEEAA